MLDGLLLISTAAFILIGGVVGARLLGAGIRARERSDIIIGFALFDLSAVAYPLILLGSIGVLPLAAARWVYAGAMLALALGWACVFVFTRRVFRQREGWALGLLGVGVVGIAYGAVAGIQHGLSAPTALALSDPAGPVFVLQIAAIAAYAWTAAEGFRAWRLALRRVRLGLSDAVVANRFLLWGWVGVFAIVTVAPSVVVGLAGGDVAANVPARLANVLGGSACAVAMQLAFLPPARYRAWIERRAVA